MCIKYDCASHTSFPNWSVWFCRIDDNMKVMFSIDVYLSETDRLAVPDSSDDSQQRVSMHAEEDAKRVR